MECLSKSTARRILCFLLAVVMVCCCIPGREAGAFAAANNEGQAKLSTGEEIFALDEETPNGIDSYPDDVYGVDTEQNLQSEHHNDTNNNTPFLLSRQSELALLVGDNGSDVMYRMDNLDMDQAYFENDVRWINGVNVTNSTNSSMPANKLGLYEDLYYPQSIALDRDGKGRDQFIATVGLRSGYISLVIQDARSGDVWQKSIQEASWLGGAGSGGDWLKDNYFAITAGDYDGDGRDSVIVYVCGDGDEVKIMEFSYSGSGWNQKTILKLSDVLKETTFKTASGTDMKYKPVVSLTTGDFDGDGGESFAYSAGFYNTSNSKADGFRSYSVDNLEQFATVVQVYDYIKEDNEGWSPYSPVWMYDRASSAREQDKTTGNKKYEITYMHAGVIGAGDVDGDGIDDIIAAGYTDHNYSDHTSRYAKAVYSKKNKLLQVDDIYNYSSNKQYVTSVISKDKSGKFVKTALKRTPMSTMQGYTWAKHCNDKDYEFVKLCIACGTTNGNNNPEDVFISGIVYDFSKYQPKVKYTPAIMNEQMAKTTGGNKTESSVNWIRNAAAGNFSGNDAGREQFVFTLWQKTLNAEKYSANVGAVTGVEFADEVSSEGDDDEEEGYITSYGEPEGYACSLNASDMINNNKPIHGTDVDASQLMYSAVSSNAICAVPVAVDIDDDGLLGRFRSNGYVYTDPEVLAVLQAGPYFSELDDLGGYEDPCGTSYSISFGYENGTSSSDNVSFEAGFAGEVAGPGFKTSLELGYAMDYSNSYEESYSVETTYGWTADKKDLVVISRVPQLVYTYDIFDAANNRWVTDGYNVKVPLSQRYFTLTIDDYNDFVEDYNELLDKDGSMDDDEKHELKKIEMGEDMPADHEGVPDHYWKNWGQVQNGMQLSSTSWTLGYGSGAPEFSYSSTGSKTESEEISHGFHYSLTMQGGGEFGVGEAWAGGYVNLDYSNSTGSFTTKTNTTTSGGKVQNLNMDTLVSSGGMTRDQVKSYGFTWEFGKWTRVLAEDSPAVPFYGYVVTKLSRLPGPPRVTGADKINITEGYSSTESRELSVSGEPEPEVTKVSGDDKISVSKKGGAFFLDVQPGLSLGSHGVVLKAENENGSSEFECSVVIKKNDDRLKAEKVSKMIRRLELGYLEDEALGDDPEIDDDEGYGLLDYLRAYEAYNSLTNAQKAFLSDADRQKLEAAGSLVELGRSRRQAFEEADILSQKFEQMIFGLESCLPDDDYIEYMKDNEDAAQNFIQDSFRPRLEETAGTYMALIGSSDAEKYIFLKDHNGLDKLDTVKERFESLLTAYNKIKGRDNDEAMYEAYDNNEEAKAFDADIEEFFWDADRNWVDVCDAWGEFAELLQKDCETAALLQARDYLYDALRDELERGSYEEGHSAEDYRNLGEQADRAIDVALMIDALPKGDAIRASDEEAVRAAAAAYAGLSDRQKALLRDDTRDLLTAAENRLEERIAALIDISGKALIKGVSNKVYTGKELTQDIKVGFGVRNLQWPYDYKVTYENNIKVGKATVTVTGTGDYKGTVSKTFKIVPKPTALKKLKAAKRGFTAKWKAQKTETTGYKLQYSLKKNFKGAKTVTISKNRITSKKISKLKGGKKYYVRICTYKKIGKAVYMSKWSKAKTVKTKK